MRATSSTMVNTPPMTISPLATGCKATEFTALFAPEPKLIVASRLPSAPVPL